MPIVYPSSFDGFGFVKFNINPHYVETDEKSTHMGETRDQRIKEFFEENNVPVVGLKEGAILRIENNKIILKNKDSKLFFRNKIIKLNVGRNLSSLF